MNLRRVGTSIVGIGATECAQRPDWRPRDMARTAIEMALDDAGVEAEQIDGVFASNALAGLLFGQESIRGQVFTQDVPLAGAPVFNVDNACAGGVSALALGRLAIESGRHSLVLVLGTEKMSHQDRGRPLRALDGALDVESLDTRDATAGRSRFVDIYAEKAKRHMSLFGSTADDFAAVVVKSRANAQHNPVALYRDPVTNEDVLEDRMIVDPLTASMCARVSDGAAALILSRSSSHWRNAIALNAAVVVSGGGSVAASTRAARLAYAEAGIRPRDVDVAEVHDATAAAELEAYESLGFAEPGSGHLLLREGETQAGGEIPVNTSGGLVSRGHPVGATGLLQIAELVTQLRGEGNGRQIFPTPKVGLAHNEGGLLNGDAAAAGVVICSAAQ